MSDPETMEEAAEALDDLNATLGESIGLAAAFDGELRRIHGTFSASSQNMAKLNDAMTRGLSRAIDGVVLDGMKLSDALGEVSGALVDAAWKAAKQPVVEHLGGLLSGGLGSLMGAVLPFADGGSFSQGRVMPFAGGGVVSGPTAFPMRGATGLMGEAGPEAILPLSRGADGKLGVRAAGGGQPVTVVMNISTPDVQGFQRSQSQIAAQMSRALSAGARNR